MGFNIHGTYHLQDALVNSHPYWAKQDGSNAIWFDFDYRCWVLGPKEYVGITSRITTYIVGPRGIDRSPTKIKNEWKYYDYDKEQWRWANTSEITFKDMNPSRH